MAAGYLEKISKWFCPCWRGERESAEMSAESAGVKMIVGLGNPGRKYERTRHNIGFRVLDLVAESMGAEVKKKKFGAFFGECRFEDKKLILLKPLSFMNRSGQVVATATGFYRLSFCDLLVVTDDMALDVGRVRVRSKGSSGGHKGLADIIAKLGSIEFSRLRIGIGQSNKPDQSDYVLGEPSVEEKKVLDEAAQKAHQAVLCWVRDGVDAAMNQFN